MSGRNTHVIRIYVGLHHKLVIEVESLIPVCVRVKSMRGRM